jgi:hypothetical protein
MQSQIVHHQHGGMSFTGRPAVSVFQCKVIASALRLYASTGMKANRAYTPTNMLRTASALTGKTFKRGQYEEAAVALTELAEKTVAEQVEVISE